MEDLTCCLVVMLVAVCPLGTRLGGGSLGGASLERQQRRQREGICCLLLAIGRCLLHEELKGQNGLGAHFW